MLYRPAVKKEGQWGYSCSPHKLMGPHNPNNNKPALVAVTRGGFIRLIFQNQAGQWYDIRAEVDSVSVFAGLLTHAALCADKGM